MPIDIVKGFPKDYVLVIAEKPRAAEKIALALGKAVKYYVNKVPVWVVNREGTYYVVASAVGHMYSLYTDEKEYPVFSYRWVPRYIVKRDSKHIKQFLEVLSLLAKNAKSYISACDYDIEGSVICYMILKYHGDEHKALRAKFSSLTQHEIIKAFRDLSKLDYEMIEAGICRHILDWLWGINISRALMDIHVRAFKNWRVLSAGRVQTPTLTYVVDSIIQRRLFVPKPLAYPFMYVRIGDRVYLLEPLDPPLNSFTEAKSYIENVKKDPKAIVESISVKIAEYNPPHPFNLPDLQAEAYRILKLSPYRAQELAEDLYLEALISYPRTNSQKLPPGLNYKQVLEKLATNPTYRPLVEELLRETRGILKPNNGPKDDPAHPAIHPTGEGDVRRLTNLHLKLYDIIVRRYIATFAHPMRVQYYIITLNIHNKRYALKGVKVLEKGWSKYYPYILIKEKYAPLNLLSEGMIIPIEKVKLTIRYTQPPQLPTKLALLKWMEEVEIGTEATRAEIIETLFKRGYIYTGGGRVNVSDLAIALVNILRNYVKELISVDLTREFERMLKDIIIKKTTCKDVEEKAKRTIDQYLKTIKLNLDKIVQNIYQYIEVSNVDEQTTKRCNICKRLTHREGFCLFHYEALKRIKDSYSDWLKFNFTWDEYLRKLVKLRLTGLYIKDVCNYLLRMDSQFRLRF